MDYGNYFMLGILLNITFLMNAGSGTLYYNYPLSLVLLKDGVNTFLNKSRDGSEQKFQEAVKDVIALADKNETNVPKLLHDIETNLTSRIKSIESLAGKRFDYSAFGLGAAAFALTAVISFGLYAIYKKWYVPGTLEFNAIQKEFAEQGIRVSRAGYDVTLYLPNSYVCYDSQHARRLLEIKRWHNTLEPGLFMGMVLPLFSFLGGIGCILAGFNPHANDKFLDTYKSQLTFIQELRELHA